MPYVIEEALKPWQYCAIIESGNIIIVQSLKTGNKMKPMNLTMYTVGGTITEKNYTKYF